MTTPSNWVRLVYASRANFAAGPDNATVNSDLARILMQSRKNNPANGLVGALYFADGCFFQCLEGPTEAVDALYARLHKDPRHSDLKVLSRNTINQLSFSHWSMKFVPNASAVRDLLASNGLRIFDPYTFNTKVLKEMVNLLLQGSDLAVSEAQFTPAAQSPDGLAAVRRAKLLSGVALVVALIAVGVAVFALI